MKMAVMSQINRVGKHSLFNTKSINNIAFLTTEKLLDDEGLT